MNTIKPWGEKNKLTEEEKTYYENMFEGKYKILEQIGMTGSKTSAYLLIDKNNNKYVLKIANDKNDKEWIDRQKETIENRDCLLDGYYGNVFIPRVILTGNNFIVEEYAGEDFTKDLYDSLDEIERKQVALDIANFLNFIHQKNPVNEISPFTGFDKPTFEEIINYCNKDISEKLKNHIDELLLKYSSRDVSDEITTNVHSDIRYQNVLYNRDTKKISVIDFELTRRKNIYCDFVPAAPASFEMSYEFLSDIINDYNDLNKKIPIIIDIEKVKLLHKLGCFHEYGRCAVYRKTPSSQLKGIMETVNNRLNDIDNGFSNANSNIKT